MDAKPRLNQYSLKMAAKRHYTSIEASAYRSRLLHTLKTYLGELVVFLDREHETSDLLQIEWDLESIEAALKHLWIVTPYNDSLFMPDCLSEEQIQRISKMARIKSPNRHLRLAYSA